MNNLKRCLLLLLTLLTTLYANNHLLDKGQNGLYAEFERNDAKFFANPLSFSLGYTFKHGSSFAATYTSYHMEHLFDIDFPPNRIWYKMVGIEYGLLFNEQKESLLPIDMVLDLAYYFNDHVMDNGEGTDSFKLNSHTFSIGLSISHDFKVFNSFDIIPIISGKYFRHVDVLSPETYPGSCIKTGVLSAELRLKYKFIYLFTTYDHEFNPYDCMSLYSLFNIGWHGGLGLCFTL